MLAVRLPIQTSRVAASQFAMPPIDMPGTKSCVMKRPKKITTRAMPPMSCGNFLSDIFVTIGPPTDWMIEKIATATIKPVGVMVKPGNRIMANNIPTAFAPR